MEASILTLFEKALYHASFRKAVFSRPKDKEVCKMTATLFSHKGETLLRCERFLKDGKALHQNVPFSSAAQVLTNETENYRQINLYTDSGEAELRISEKGKVWQKDRILATEEAPKLAAHNREKEYIIDKERAFPFLFALDIVDKNGRVLDKKQSKFRQINHFLEFVRDALEQLPQNDQPLTVWDLCCGKSYLTFAVYYYLTVQEQRKVTLYAVDRKKDMMEKCQNVAKELCYDGMHFLCMDIHDFHTEHAPDMVLSLHACDIATDIVLAHAVKNQAKVILSAPCCHHEMNRQLQCEPLRFIQRHSVLKQKFCDAATDALRALRLEAEGYQVTALEFIDPEETPKNTLIRAYRMPGYRAPIQKAALQEYQNACEYLGVHPYLHKLLSENEET